MAASATAKQKTNAQQRFYRRIQRAAEVHGVDYHRARGQGPVLTDREGWQYRFAMTFSNASNGETFGQRKVTVQPPSWYGRPSATFSSWCWCGSKANQTLADFWTMLAGRGRQPRLLLGDLRNAWGLETDV